MYGERLHTHSKILEGDVDSLCDMTDDPNVAKHAGDKMPT